MFSASVDAFCIIAVLPLFPDEGVAAALARRSRLRVSARSLLAAMRWRICGESIGEDLLPPALAPLPPEYESGGCDEMGGTEDAEDIEEDEEDEEDEDTEDGNCCACMCGRNMSPSMFRCWLGDKKDERNEEGRRGGEDKAGGAEVEEEDDDDDDDDDDGDDDGDDEHEGRDFLRRSSRRISCTASRTLRLSARLALESRLFPICFQIRSK